MYYALTLDAKGTNAPAFYSLTPTSNLTISQGGATIAPSSPSASGIIVNVYPQTLQVSGPAGIISAGVTIITTENHIAGRVMVSAAITVATVVTLFGAGGKQLGQAIVDPGQTSTAFSWDVPAGSGLADAAEAQSLIAQKIGAQTPPEY